MKIQSLLLVLISGSNYECSTRPNIIFLDEAKRIIFETEDMMFSITEDFIKREDYERACNNLRINLNTIVI